MPRAAVSKIPDSSITNVLFSKTNLLFDLIPAHIPHDKRHAANCRKNLARILDDIAVEEFRNENHLSAFYAHRRIFVALTCYTLGPRNEQISERIENHEHS